MYILLLEFQSLLRFWIRLLQEVGRLGSRKPVNYTSWAVVVTSTKRPKSVCNRCVIKHFGDVFVLVLCCLEFSVGIQGLLSPIPT